MNRIFLFIFSALLLLFSRQTAAQLFDDLFEEEDFQSSEIDKMQQQEAERKKTEEKNNTETVPAEKSVQAVAAPVVQQTQPAQIRTPSIQAKSAAEEKEEKEDETFSLSTAKPQEIKIPALPQVGSGKMPDLPDLGSQAAKKKEDENLSLFEMRSKKTGSSDTDVLKFDIAGIRLKMTPQEAMQEALNAGFSLKFQDRKIPTLNEWKYRRLCMQQMLFAYEHKKRCVQEIARYNNSEYTSRLVFENKSRRETLTVEFASGFAENRAYRIRYVSKGDHSLGTTDEAHYFKTKRRQEFLKLLITKYGVPDDEQTLLWGVSGLGATLQAEISDSFLDASLVLEDLSIETEDFDNMSVQDAKDPSIEKFSF